MLTALKRLRQPAFLIALNERARINTRNSGRFGGTSMPIRDAMTTQEIQDYIEAAVASKFDGYTTDSLEMMTSEEGDGRFFGNVVATRYGGLPPAPEIYLAIGTTDKGVQIVKFGMSETLTPEPTELDFLLLKELGIEKK